MSRAASSSMPQQLLGLLCVLGSTLFFSGMSLGVSLLSRAPDTAPPLITVTARFVAQASLSAAAIALLRRGRLAQPATWLGSRGRRYAIVARGGWGVCGLTCWFLSLTAMPLSDATAITYLNIPLSAIFARLLLKEAYGYADAAAAALAMLGALLVAQPEALFGTAAEGAGAPLPLAAVLVALLGAVCSAMAYVSARAIGPGEDTLVVVLLFAALGLCIAPLAAAATGAFDAPPPTPRAAALLVAVGVSGWAGQLLLNAGLVRAPSGPAALMKSTDIIVALVLQVAVMGDPTNALKVVGCVLVLSTVAATLVKNARKAAPAAEATPALPATAVTAAETAAAAAAAAAEEPQQQLAQIPASEAPALQTIVVAQPVLFAQGGEAGEEERQEKAALSAR